MDIGQKRLILKKKIEKANCLFFLLLKIKNIYKLIQTCFKIMFSFIL